MDRVTATRAIPPVSNPLRIVLFGMPHAGKSSLLGALAEVAEHQAHALKGRLDDPTLGLADLQHRLYDGTARQTSEEVVPYPVTFEPSGATGSQSALLVDCDGRVANRILTDPNAVQSAHESAPLADAVVQADTLVLVIDAATDPSKLDVDFAEFVTFLRHLRTNRGDRADVGGLPVFLVLSKCDLLAQAEDTLEDWVHRIEERKQDVARRFQEFIEEQAAVLSFGAIDLDIWATAVKRPALANTPARPREPFGVGELFSQCLDRAAGFRSRQRRSRRLLAWMLTTTVVVLVSSFALTIGLIIFRGDARGGGLAERVEAYRRLQCTSAEQRLAEPLQPKRRALLEIRSHPEFAKLTSDDQVLIQAHLLELDTYAAYKARLAKIDLDAISTMKDLDAAEDFVKNHIAPAPYTTDWVATEAAQSRQKLVQELAALRQAVTFTADWFHHQIRGIEDARTFAREKPDDSATWTVWMQRAGGSLNPTFPRSRDERLPGSDQLTYANALRFDEINVACVDLSAAAERLERNIKLFSALGMVGPIPNGDSQPLDISVGLRLADAHARWTAFESRYPDLAKQTDPPNVPEAVEADIRGVARKSYDHLIAAGREAILNRLKQQGPERETLDSWRGILPWIEDDAAWNAWRRLATMLGKLADVRNPDPVQALTDFLQRDRFELDIRQATLDIPDNMSFRPTGSLSILLGRGDAATPVLTLKLLDTGGRRDAERQITIYSFAPEGRSTFTYQLGAFIYASVPVKKDGDPAEWRLTWARRRSELWTFEALSRPPRLHRAELDNTEGELLDNVSLHTLPPSGMPKVPDLIPVVDLKK